MTTIPPVRALPSVSVIVPASWAPAAGMVTSVCLYGMRWATVLLPAESVTASVSEVNFRSAHFGVGSRHRPPIANRSGECYT